MYFQAANCSNGNACDLIQNGDFEVSSYSIQCGNLQNQTNLDCWYAGANYPARLNRNCNSNGGIFNIGVNTFGLTGASSIDSHNGAPNNSYIKVGTTFISPPLPTSIGDILETNLSTSLTPNQVYQVSCWIYNPAVSLSTNVAPIVLSFSTVPVLGFFGPSTLLVSFTCFPTGAWTQITQTLTFTAPIGHQGLRIAIDPTTLLFTSSNTVSSHICFIDDISIVSFPSPTLQFPTTCGNFSLSNLNQYASITGTFSGQGVTTSGSGNTIQYHFNQSLNLQSGVYPVAFTYSVPGCVKTIYQNITINPTITLLASASPYCQNSNIPGVVTASVNGNQPSYFMWAPGNLYGATQNMTLTSPAIYTVTAQTGACSLSRTVAVSISSTCCTFTQNNYLGSILGNLTYTGSFAINNNLQILSGNTAFLTGEFMFAPNTKITVNPGATLFLQAAHLYACSNTMWEGIEVLDGGYVNTDPGNLIEDAKTAIKAINQFTSSGCMNIKNTVFNKNYIDISISKANCASGSPASIQECVFTCRNLPFNSTTWPTTGTSSVGTGITAELRYANYTATTGLSSPYFAASGFTVTNLKNPHNTHPSQTAIYLTDVGSTNSNSFKGIIIGSNSQVSDFNVFDAHGDFIAATHSNIDLRNNVFQNTQFYYAVEGGPGSNSIYTGGRGIAIDNGIMNTALTMTASSFNLGNKFWDCHTAMSLGNTLKINYQKNIIRSSQTNTNSTNQVGDKGMVLGTSKFSYYINDNEFTNIKKALIIPISANVYSTVCSGTQTGIYSDKIIISNNTISSGTVAGNYVSKAIDISSPNNVAPNDGNDYTTIPYSKGVIVENNTLTSVYRGISFNGFTALVARANNNLISMRQEPNGISAQRGIEVVNNTGGNVSITDWMIVKSNTLSTTTPTNVNETSVFLGNNIGLYSPSVTCNTINSGNKGFVFDQGNSMSTWMGNVMQPLAYGLSLTNGGVMGTQGSTYTAIHNQWVGTWSGWNTFVDAASSAVNSSLWLSSGTGNIPSVNIGPVGMDFGSNYTITSTGANYDCSANYLNKYLNVPHSNQYYEESQFKMAQLEYYKFLYHNDSLRAAHPDLSNFYNSFIGTTYDLFIQIEENINSLEMSSAKAKIDAISPTNEMEQNYLTYYSIFVKFIENKSNGGILSSSDSSALITLANSCPNVIGGSVYQARALYTTIYHEILNYPDCAAPSAKESSKNNSLIGKQLNTEEIHNLNIEPNPSDGSFMIAGFLQDRQIRIRIEDLTKRIVYEKELSVQNSFAKLETDLINGIYFITLTSYDNSTRIFKIVISR